MSSLRRSIGIACWLLASSPAAAHATEPELDLFGDLRFRLEADWDSQREDGSKREDRRRARARARVGIEVRTAGGWTLGARARTGSTRSQQSSHVTLLDFDHNPTGDHHLLLDKWFARRERGASWSWFGRNSFPFWKQNEMFWDDDVTLTGLALGRGPGDSGLSLTAGYFALPDGGVDTHGRLFGGQLAYRRGTLEARQTLVAGALLFDGEGGAERLRRGNGARDYSLWLVSYQARTMRAGREWRIGLDLVHNAESYSANDPDPWTAANRSARDGWVVCASTGRREGAADWSAAYTYAHIETLAVNASYAQDDWVRWGSATQTDSSDLKGHELRLSLSLSETSNLDLRLFLVDAISSGQDGKRLRIDYNWTF